MKDSSSERSSSQSAISIGTTTIVLIFVLLCLLTFSVLSLVSARANMRLSQKSADRTTAYYEAENASSDILIQVTESVQKCLNTSDENTFFKKIRTELEGKNGICFTDDETLTWTVPLAQNQYLRAEVKLSYQPFSNGNHYRIIAWNTCTDYDWGADQSLPLLENDTMQNILMEE